MPTFETPTPIDLAIDLPVGHLEIVASDRSDTVVTVEPTNPARAVDRRGADETKVELSGTRLVVAAPRPRFSIIGPTESIDVRVEVPTGSRLTVEMSVGAVVTAGRLGATRIKNATGMVEVDGTGDLWVRAGHGSVITGAVDGGCEITADHGQIRVGSVAGDALLKASHGAIAVGVAGGDVEAKLSYGDLDIEVAQASVTAKLSYGGIRIREISSGSVQVESGYGQIDIGVRPGVAAWLDLSSKEGRVRNSLEGDRAPEPSEDTVAVRARTHFGDITIQRSTKGTNA
jgi:hypothetical protein